MRKVVILCLLSALAGVVMTRWLPGFRQDRETTLPAVANADGKPANSLDGPLVELSEPSVRPNEQTDLVVAVADNHLTPEERVNVAVYEKVNRSVVNVNTRTVRADPFFMFETPSEGAGSGSVLDRAGHILTNFHVIEGANAIQITLFNGTTYDARPVGVDPNTDLAVVKIDAPQEMLFPVAIGDSMVLKVGQRVLAIGNPFGLERTLTVGIVSSLNRMIRSRNNRQIRSIIQTDAAINPGNSGGPLLNSRGKMIGVTTAIASRTGQSAGVGFAIPASAVRRIVPQLVRDGKVIRADIGIARVVETENGLVIVSTTSGGPAEKAGLQGFRLVKKRRKQGPFIYEQTRMDRSAADRIIAVDNVRITSADRFLDLIESNRPGDSVTVTIVRDGEELQVQVKLKAGDD